MSLRFGENRQSLGAQIRRRLIEVGVTRIFTIRFHDVHNLNFCAL